MNKYLNLAHWLLVIVAIVSVAAAGQAGVSLWQASKVNNFISEASTSEPSGSESSGSESSTSKEVPAHLKAQFAQAYNDVEQGKNAQALDRLTAVLETEDASLEAATYFNRGNINLRKAQALPTDDSGRIALISLAKQDYRMALLLDPSLWNARFNLELALLMVPEEALIVKAYSKRKGSESVVVKAVGFRVDLP